MHRLLFPLFLSLALGVAACHKTDSGNAARATETASAAAVYDCPMHPEVRQSTPGKCPKCGMTLVKVLPGSATAAHEHGPGTPPHEHAGGDAPADDGADRPHADHNPKHGGMLGMQGDYHLELVARHGGDLDVYVYDAFTRPLEVGGARGRVRLEMPEGQPEVSVPIEPSADRSALHGRAAEADRAVSATIDLSLPDTTLSMSFPLQATLTGEIVDIDCLVRLGDQGKGSIHAECARECIRNGMPVGLAVGKTVYVLTLAGSGPDRAANERLAQLAGRQVNVTGRVREAGGIKMIELADVEPVES